MSDEASISWVQIQLFDETGSFCAGLNHGEMAEHVFLDALAEAGVEPPGAHTNPDAIITADRLPDVLNSIRRTLQKIATTIDSSEVPNAYDTTLINVLGRPIHVRAREATHYNLMRINDLYQGLERLVGLSRNVDALSLPRLDAMDHAILVAAKDAVPRTRLSVMLQHRFAHLKVMTRSSENVSHLRRQAALAADDDVVERHLKRLEKWNLVRQAEDGTVQATRKLMAVRI